ncbi:Transcription initiation factor IIF alpha subunit [hydrothermal vent metagenome]|uniref:Transcription initiation factor IIF alpha subunit n=1 Tax=hydrothermal vent metagenome TaxID=652676 RepID=A0A1W1BYY9_9ZZZZ
MHILLINVNPVVSRLLILCTRDDTILLDEVESVDKVSKNHYDIVFVDESSYGRDVMVSLERLKSLKKVFISYLGDEVKGFDATIKKPFLPSQITEVIAAVQKHRSDEGSERDEEGSTEDKFSIFPLSAEEIDENTTAVLDVDEIEKIKALLNMDDDSGIEESKLSEEEIEALKVEVIKEQLIADGLEIINENEIVESLNLESDNNSKFVRKTDKKKKKSKKQKLIKKNIKYVKDAVERAVEHMTKKQVKRLLKGKEVKITIQLEDKN